MDRTEEEVRPGRQRRCRDSGRLPGRDEVERTEEECRRSWRAEQNLIQRADDTAAAELRDLRERVRLAAAVRHDERRALVNVYLLRREMPRAGELVIHELRDEIAERCAAAADTRAGADGKVERNGLAVVLGDDARRISRGDERDRKQDCSRRPRQRGDSKYAPHRPLLSSVSPPLAVHTKIRLKRFSGLQSLQPPKTGSPACVAAIRQDDPQRLTRP